LEKTRAFSRSTGNRSLGTERGAREARRMKRTIASLAVALAFGAAAPASAEGPSTIHGVVYECATRHALANAYVTLRGVDNGETFKMRTDARGRFARVGLTPGRWLIEASSRPAAADRDAASRLATLETDDVLDMVIGTRLVSPARETAVRAADRPANANTPHPLCDSARVPQAPTTADRTIIH
jgi:Carboxypeptidase regulatory-like domain